MSKTRSVVSDRDSLGVHSSEGENIVASFPPYPYPVVDIVSGAPIEAVTHQAACFSLFKPKKRHGYEKIKCVTDHELSDNKHRHCQIL